MLSLEKNGIPLAVEARERSKKSGMFQFMERLSQDMSDAMNEGRHTLRIDPIGIPQEDMRQVLHALLQAGYAQVVPPEGADYILITWTYPAQDL